MDDVLIVGSRSEILASMDRIREFCLGENLILRAEKTKIHPIRDGVKFCGYEIREGRLLAGRRIRLGFQRFMDVLADVSEAEKIQPVLNRSDWDRLRSIHASRSGCFRVTDPGLAYAKTRGTAEFIRGGNANNGTNDGVFTLNLN